MSEKQPIGTWIDPPSGWKYGFPLIKTCDTPLDQWLMDNGYPMEDSKLASELCCCWPAYEDDENK